MWITASSAVALVVALAAFAALGGYLLSMGVDKVRSENYQKVLYETVEYDVIWKGLK